MPHTTDLDLTAKEVTELASPDAITAFLAKLGYDTGDRALLSPEAVGLSGDSANAIKKIELLSEDPEQFLRVVFAQPKSLTAKVRNDLVRVLGKSNLDHMLVLASDFDTLEFVFLDKRKREQKGPGGTERIQVVPKTISVSRRSPTRLDLRTLRRFTWTCRDALEQFDKLRSVFDAAAYTGEYFQNRGLFSDYLLRDRLREDPAWRDNPSEMFAFVRDLLRDAQARWGGKDKDTLRSQLLEPLFKKLGFKPTVNRPSKTNPTEPDYILKSSDNGKLTAAFVYAWDRWLDGPDLGDTDTPEENPGACVVTALDAGTADWIIVTNGRLWRLYSRQAHARATNFYEVDLVEALTASGDTDPNEAFRYWWLFLRPAAFKPKADGQGCWLDEILLGSREYAKRLGDRLKDRIFLTIFPHLAQGILEDRKHRLGQNKSPTEEELADTFEATLTLLYRLLFLLYAESRDLLPIREAPYQAASFKKIKDEIADKAGVAESEVGERLNKAFSAKDTTLYDRLFKLFQAMDKGDPILNVPTYNGGLFNTTPDKSDRRDQRIARFLLEHKLPDRYLALAIDRLARDQDERTLALVFIDYKSLEVRHLGSIYEGLLEFKLKVADEDLTTQADKKGETYIPLSQARVKRGRQAEVVVRKKEVYLSNDEAERKASGSYYTPDSIVEYIVAHTVGPVLDEKLEALRGEFRKVRKTFDNELQKSQAYPSKDVSSGKMDHRQWAGLQTYNAHKDLVEQLFDLRVLDPAMGSGHFLVEVVDFVTDKLLNFLNQFPKNPVNFALDRTRTSILESLGEQGVTVDPAKLTDINLLKRHVLKRCIYGVDLNPMAVELAKVSLWLDAFTLGAPLNFLDHHLRCGNSLIGATFNDLEKATATLFALNYEPLLRAINHVLFVSKMADATAAEVATSVSRYDQARQFLAGYQIILDFLVAQHFGLPQARGIVEMGSHLDLSSREKFDASLEDEKERQLVAQVEALAQRPDRRFFHWEIEFPEVFFGFIDADERQIKHKDRIKEGSAGFDCVVGNPPYVSFGLRGVGTLDADLRKYYIANYPRAAQYKITTYALFVEKCLCLLRSSGRSGLVLPDSFLLGKYYEGVRRNVLAQGARVLDLLLFQQSFWGDGDVGCPVVLITSGQAQAKQVHLGYIKALGSFDCGQNAYHYRIPSSTYATAPRSRFYFFLCDEDLAVYRRLMDNSVALATVVKFYSGLIGKAGQASIVFDESQARATGFRVSKLVESGSFLQPFSVHWNGKYIVHSPSLYKSGYSPEYYESPKLFLNQTGDHPKTCVDEQGFYCLNNMHVGYPLAGLDPLYFVAGVLNSKFGNVFYRFLSMESGRALAQLDIDMLDLFPLPSGVEHALSRQMTVRTDDLTNLPALQRVAAISRELHRIRKEAPSLVGQELMTLLDNAVLESYQVEPAQFEGFAARRELPFGD